MPKDAGTSGLASLPVEGTLVDTEEGGEGY
jgi:hypothetical protein